MKKSFLLAIMLSAGYFVTGCANDGGAAGGSTSNTTSNPSAGATGAVSDSGGTGIADHGTAAHGGR